MKSPPELWAQCSDAESLGRHLQAFGEIRITRLEPETTVAWEGERARGTVRIEPSGWGTKVTLTADADEVGAEPAPAAAPALTPAQAPAPVPTPVPVPVPVDPVPVLSADADEPVEGRRRTSLFGWLLGRRSAAPAMPAEASADLAPEAFAEPAPEPAREEPVVAESVPPIDADAALDAALASLGQAHHRPFSRS